MAKSATNVGLRQVITLTMTRQRALELDLLFCKCGHRVNNHFDFGDKACAHCSCKNYHEVPSRGVTKL